MKDARFPSTYTLEELKELEAKAKDLEHYTLNLGLWK